MNKQFSRQNVTESSRFIDDSQLSKKELRIKEAIFLYYMEDMTQQEVADEIGVTRQTISEYLNSEEAKYFEPVFSSKEKNELMRWLQDGIYNTFRESQEALRNVKNSKDAKPATVTSAAKEMVKNKKRLIELLQLIHEMEKPKERKEVTENSGDEVNELADAWRSIQEQEEGGEEADAEVQG